MTSEKDKETGRTGWNRLFRMGSKAANPEESKSGLSTWSMGILNDKETMEVPGSVLLLAANRNEPLGLRNVHARTSHSSIPTGFHVDVPLTPGGTRPMPGTTSPGTPASAPVALTNPEDEGKKKTNDGEIILDPQPEESANDPLNWPEWRRNVALLCLGFYCMIGGGLTPIIAAGFTDVAETFHVEVERVSLTTGLYMMGLGLGSVIASPVAILYGKRPVYLFCAVIFITTALWAGWSNSFQSLLAARVFQGIALSPVECLPSATIAEIFFLHERAYRIGIYTLLLLGGKNLIPLVSAAIIGSLGWRWTFWIVAIVAGFGLTLLFLFVPETFWDRTPTRKHSKRPGFIRRLSSRHGGRMLSAPSVPLASGAVDLERQPRSPAASERAKDRHVDFVPSGSQGEAVTRTSTGEVLSPTSTGILRSKSKDGRQGSSTPQSPEPIHHHHKRAHVGFAETDKPETSPDAHSLRNTESTDQATNAQADHSAHATSQASSLGKHVPEISIPDDNSVANPTLVPASHNGTNSPRSFAAATPDLRTINSPYSIDSVAGSAANIGYFTNGPNLDNEKIPASALRGPPKVQAYTHNLRQQPARSFVQQLKPFHGRLNNDKFFKVMLRPFILFSYPAVLWSSIVYACSIGWLIVISESLAQIFRTPEPYNFNALQTGLVYISPFVGGILGTGVAGKVSDIIVRAITRRNGGLYEPEFRLVMVIPILITTCIGLMGFGWSAQEKDHWIVPTLFFGIVSFGCSLGSTTSITFCVDSYRHYAGEALVTLNFSKNVLHGLIFSLFVTNWLAADGPKMVYIWIGIIQLLLLLLSIPMYIFGKRARMWTARRNLMERF